MEQCPPFFCTVWSPENSFHFPFMLLELDVSFIRNLSSTIAAITVSLASEMSSQILQSLHYQHLLGVASNPSTENVATLPIHAGCSKCNSVYLTKLNSLVSFFIVLPSMYMMAFYQKQKLWSSSYPHRVQALFLVKETILKVLYEKNGSFGLGFFFISFNIFCIHSFSQIAGF